MSVDAVPADAGHRLIGRYLPQQARQHRYIFNAVVRALDGPNLQCVGIDPQVHFAPLPAVLSPVILAFPLAFAQKRDPAQSSPAPLCWPGRAVAPAAFWRWLTVLKSGTFQSGLAMRRMAIHQAQALTQSQAEQAFDAQAELDGGAGEAALASTFAAGRYVPRMSLSSQIVSDPLSLSAALYSARLVVL